MLVNQLSSNSTARIRTRKQYPWTRDTAPELCYGTEPYPKQARDAALACYLTTPGLFTPPTQRVTKANLTKQEKF